ncbi:DUF5704 domain-containing protein [Paenibacillus sp. WLX2291]|uniref:DUF5704 domain-containing protein n=1 Tax=Paenibacillus sp. WLX2291 TaxID=3296934 RepID=UPI003984275E
MTKKKMLILLIFIVLSNTILNEDITKAESNESLSYPSDAVVSPKGPSKVQTIEIPLTGEADPRPKVIWVQTDGEEWTASRNDGYDNYTTGTHGEKNDTYPLAEIVKNKITAEQYPPKSMVDANRKPYNQKYISDLGFEKIEFNKQFAYDIKSNEKTEDKRFYYYGGKSIEYEKGAIFAIIYAETGYPYIPQGEYKYSTRADGYDKRKVEYYTPLQIQYTGHVTEKKEIQVTEDAELQVGDTTQLAAEVRTKTYDMQDFDDNWTSVTNRTQTTWESSDTSVATVSPTGLVTALAEGTTQVSATWKSADGVWNLKDTVEIAVGVDQQEPPPEPTGICSIPQPGKQIIGKYMDPLATAVIKADKRDSEQFDVSKGIPTSESLYGNVLARTYLSKHTFTEYSGVCTYKVVVKRTYNLKWENNAGRTKRATETKNYSYDVKRPYSYWKIDNLEVYKIDQATLMNYAFSGETIEISPNNYISPSFSAKTTGAYDAPPTPGVINGGNKSLTGNKSRPSIPNESSSFKNKAENAVDDVEVENDYLKFNNDVLMDNTKTAVNGPDPKPIPEPQMIGKNILYSTGNTVPISKTNRSNTTSKGSIDYIVMPGNIKGGANASYDIYGINTVTVHTPVVNYSSISDDKQHNQKTQPTTGRMALILDRPFTVRIPTSGQHVNYPGYGNRDYAKYVKAKQVLFPFDVYSKDRTTFYPKNTWINVPVSQLDTVFNLPVWIDEGNYTVSFRTIAENAPASFTAQQDANTDLTNHVAKDTVEVEVIGRMYDFRVTDIADFNWEQVFRKATGSNASTGAAYWVGTGNIDGAARGNQAPYTLPIMRGSHPSQGYKNIAVKTGYHFKFDLKTKGNLFGDKDAIRITPSFVYQDKDTATAPKRIPVDLYYHSDQRKFIKIGSSADTERRTVTLNQRLRNVPTADLNRTAATIYELNQGWTVSKEQYIASFLKRAQQTTYTGGYDIQILPSPLRTFISSAERPDNASASQARVNASVQQWYGEYSLPANVYAVPQGTNLAEYGRTHTLDEKAPIFLKQGYITVNFDLESIVNGNTSQPHLQYIHAPLDNQWWDMEQFDNTDGERDRIVTDPYNVKYIVADGDVIFYDTDESSYSDFKSSGTH